MLILLSFFVVTVMVSFTTIVSIALNSIKALDGAYRKYVALILLMIATVSILVAPRHELKNFAYVINK